jgi:hypothetical protein
MTGWIGVDFDGTLVTYDGWKGVGHIGEPVPAMVERVKRWIAEGKEVRVFTARVWVEGRGGDEEAEKARRSVQDWCEQHIGTRLAVTNVKDFGMSELWDDRAIQVEKNTGRRMDGADEPTALQLGAAVRAMGLAGK